MLRINHRLKNFIRIYKENKGIKNIIFEIVGNSRQYLRIFNRAVLFDSFSWTTTTHRLFIFFDLCINKFYQNLVFKISLSSHYYHCTYLIFNI